jgi:hypothetical protein
VFLIVLLNRHHNPSTRMTPLRYDIGETLRESLFFFCFGALLWLTQIGIKLKTNTLSFNKDPLCFGTMPWTAIKIMMFLQNTFQTPRQKAAKHLARPSSKALWYRSSNIIILSVSSVFFLYVSKKKKEISQQKWNYCLKYLNGNPSPSLYFSFMLPFCSLCSPSQIMMSLPWGGRGRECV